MANCPQCAKPLVKESKSKYFCKNQSCPVIFVRCPHEPTRMRVALASLTKEGKIREIERATGKKMSHVL